MDSIDEGVWAEAGSHQNIREVRGGKQSLEIRGCQSEESVQGTAARARTHTHTHTHTHTQMPRTLGVAWHHYDLTYAFHCFNYILKKTALATACAADCSLIFL